MDAHTLRTRPGCMLSAAATVLLCWSSVHGEILVDSFSDADAVWPQTLATTGFLDQLEGPLDPNTVLGAYRDTRFGGTLALDVDEIQLGVFPAEGVLDYAASAGAQGFVALTYDANDVGLGIDVTDEDRIRVEIVDFDGTVGGSGGLEVSALLSDGDNEALVTAPLITAAGNYTVDMFLADLVPLDGDLPDLTSIEIVALNFSSGLGGDFRVDDIRFIPEPTALLMVGFGLLLGMRRFR